MNQKGEKSLLYDKDLQRVKELCLFDDEFMTIVFDDDIEATELLLNIILSRTDLTVTEVVGQREIKSPTGRSVRLDILAKDKYGRNYDVEIQREDRGANAMRARFNSSMMDTTMLKSGQDYAELADSYVIFITERDVIRSGLPVYHIDRYITETDTLFGDGSHIIYVNGEYNNETDDVGRLMHDFKCTDASEMNFSILADRVKYFKETGRGQEIMSRVMEEIRAEGMEEGIVEGAYSRSVEVAIRLIKQGKQTTDEIAYLTGLSVEEVNELAP